MGWSFTRWRSEGDVDAQTGGCSMPQIRARSGRMYGQMLPHSGSRGPRAMPPTTELCHAPAVMPIMRNARFKTAPWSHDPCHGKCLLKFALRLSRALACPIESIGVPTRRPAYVGPMLWVRRSRHVVTVRPAYALFTPKFPREQNVCCRHFCCFPIVPACNALEGWKHTGTALDNRNA